MNQWIALFRGINVGGHNKLPMKELRQQMNVLDFAKVRTYIASGNLLFDAQETDARKLETQISANIETHQGFAPKVLIVDQHRLARTIAQCPFSPSTDEERHLHVFFWAKPGAVTDIEPFEAIKAEREKIHLTDEAFYLFSPEGLGRSKLGSRVEKISGIAATARNWRTVKKLKAMTQE